MKRFTSLVIAVLLLAMAIPVFAQEQTATITGTVTDQSGAALPGVTVEAVSGRGQRFSSVTDNTGLYRFPALPSGRYTITATLSGMEPASVKDVEVTLGSAPKIDMKLRVGAVAETISVTAEAPIVDVTTSATSTSIAREQLEYIPKGRDFQSVVTQAAGASNEGFLGGISIDGASGSENRFVIDGVETTHPQDGLSGQALITDFIEEVQVKSAGYAAEFGGSVGGVINVITKTGTNDFRGWVNSYFTDSSWTGKQRPETYETATGLYRTFKKDDTMRFEPGVALGGPIVRDRLWFFAGYNPALIHTERTPEGSTTTYEQDQTVNYFTGNLTGTIGTKFNFKAAASLSPSETEGILPARDNTTPAGVNLAITTEFPTSSYSLYGDFLPSSQFYLSGRAGMYQTDIKTSGVTATSRIFFRNGVIPVPTTDPRYRPTGFATVPAASYSNTEMDKWDRNAASMDANLFVRGGHAFKAGIQYEKIENEVANYLENGNLYEVRWGLADRFGAGVIGTYGSVHVRRFGTVGAAESRNLGFYLQDSWSIRPNFILNVGVRTEKEQVPNYGARRDPTLPEWAIEFNYGDKLAPRVGFAYDVFSNQKLKLYGSYGTYYDITKIEMPRGSFGADQWIAYLYPLNTLDWQTLPNGCTISTNNPAVNPCPALGTPVVLDLRHPTDPHEAIDPDLKPMEQREFQFGADWQLNAHSLIGARLVDKSLINTIEDIGFLVESAPGVFEEHYITGNPGKGLVAGDPPGAVPAQPKAVRDYQAVELRYERRFKDNFSLRGNYTWSRLEGNYSGLASSDEFGRTDPNVSRSFDALHNAFGRDGKEVVGVLNTDRPHQFELQGLYRAPWGTSFGVNTSWRSGTPISEQISYIGVPFFPNGRGNLGRYDALTATDLLVAHQFNLGRYGLELSANILNLFDEDTVTQVGVDHYREDLCTAARRLPTTTVSRCDQSQEWFFNNVPKLNMDTLMSASPVNPYYKQPLAYQGARSVRLGVKFTF